MTREEQELRQAAQIASAMAQDVDELFRLIAPSKRGSNVQRMLDRLKARAETIDICLRDAEDARLAALPREGEQG